MPHTGGGYRMAPDVEEPIRQFTAGPHEWMYRPNSDQEDKQEGNNAKTSYSTCPNCSRKEKAEGEVSTPLCDDRLDRRSQSGRPNGSAKHRRLLPCHEREPDAGLHPNTINPSLRRDGIRIWFDCELCSQISCLCIYQQEEQTFIYMEANEEIQKLEG